MAQGPSRQVEAPAKGERTVSDEPVRDDDRNPSSSEDDSKPSRSITWNQGVVVAGLVMSLPWLIFGPAAFGYYLDYVFGSSPWLSLIGLGIGLIGSAIDVFVILKRVGLMK